MVVEFSTINGAISQKCGETDASRRNKNFDRVIIKQKKIVKIVVWSLKLIGR